MDQRISLITLGVDDMERAAAFYEALGWTRVESPDGVIAFDLIGQTLGLYPKADLARDMGVAAETLKGSGGVTLAHNLREKHEVGLLAARWDKAGGTVLKAPHDVFWGGCIAYVADPDGVVWELAWNPHAPLGQDGAFQWNGAL
ncbi:VOC family protein [Anianabacter salinae]|uniref:VOC family protein n=1 Tax=Anianabacter salinae TaxID=2851023 RepID=UPI00225E17AA|nr:VOC family protein [Anianabacter salinae]MBV0912572.1 VOC family protein [Anianabacter salinae]